MDRAIIEARTLKGFRDLLPQEAELKGAMLQTLERVFRSFGFPRIETPHLEYAEVLLGDAGAEINKQVYRFTDHGDRAVALRFDLTVPLARYVVQHRHEVGLPFRRYAIGSAFRGENTQAGRYREFTQCDFDIIGAESFDAARGADAEIVQIIAAALSALQVREYVIRVNNRKIFNGLCECVGIGDKSVDALRIVDKLGKIGQSGVREELAAAGLAAGQIDELLGVIDLSKDGDAQAIFSKLSAFKQRGGTIAAGITELERVFEILAALPDLAGTCVVDLSIARGLGYYTGIVFETYLKALPRIGSVCSGGRYANLTATFSRERLPGVGSSVGVDRLIAALTELGLNALKATPAALLVLAESEQHLPQIHRLAQELRALAINVEVYPEVAKVASQFKYAERKGHRFVLRLGKDGGWLLKDITAAAEWPVSSAQDIAVQVRKE